MLWKQRWESPSHRRFVVCGGCSNREKIVVAMRLTLVGRVQGIGLRPAVARWANELCEHLPQAARVESIGWETAELLGLAEFEILEGKSKGPLSARVPPDIHGSQPTSAPIEVEPGEVASF